MIFMYFFRLYTGNWILITECRNSKYHSLGGSTCCPGLQIKAVFELGANCNSLIVVKVNYVVFKELRHIQIPYFTVICYLL